MHDRKKKFSTARADAVPKINWIHSAHEPYGFDGTDATYEVLFLGFRQFS